MFQSGKRNFSSLSNVLAKNVIKPSKAIPEALFSRKSILANLNLYKKSVLSREVHNEQELLKGLDQLYDINTSVSKLSYDLKKLQQERISVEKLVAQGTKSPELFKKLKDLKKKNLDITEPLSAYEASSWNIINSMPNTVDPTNPDKKPLIVGWINPKHKLVKSSEKEYQGDVDYSSTYTPNTELDHLNILTEKKHLLDFYAGSNVSGSNCYYLFDEMLEMENALIAYALKFAKTKGFQLSSTPSFAKLPMIAACGYRPSQRDMDSQIYTLNGTDQALIATSEITLAGYEMSRTFSQDELPLKRCGLSRAFRKEAAAQGAGVRGLYRVHEFNKVELFAWTTPEQSSQTLEDMKDLQIEIIKSLGLTAQILQMPNNDLGAPAYKKYDIECWMPGRGTFGEITSTSNCTDFQSRRLATRFKKQGKLDDNKKGKSTTLEFVHTLNGTCMALPRVLLAIVENNYDPKTNKVKVPDVLVPYMGISEF
ncbi:hypothetical protein QEN19_001190 [Hanseniaspora menglaensis]